MRNRLSRQFCQYPWGSFLPPLGMIQLTQWVRLVRSRTNLILANTAEGQVNVDVTLVAASGAQLGTAKHVTLLPPGMTQLNRVARELGVNGDLASGRLVLSTPTYRDAFAGLCGAD